MWDFLFSHLCAFGVHVPAVPAVPEQLPELLVQPLLLLALVVGDVHVAGGGGGGGRGRQAKENSQDKGGEAEESRSRGLQLEWNIFFLRLLNG